MTSSFHFDFPYKFSNSKVAFSIRTLWRVEKRTEKMKLKQKQNRKEKNFSNLKFLALQWIYKREGDG